MRRRSVPVNGGPKVLVDPSRFPAVVRADDPDVDAAAWLDTHRDTVQKLLHTVGAVVLRGFGVSGPDELERLVLTLSPEAMNYVYGSTPRTRELRQVYTSTEYPADQAIPMHNELAYSRSWPMRLWFLSVTAATTGGATPLADSRRVHDRIPRPIRDRFAERGVRYVRNYGTGMDLSWQQAFETEDRRDVDRFCEANGIAHTWSDDGRLRTEQVAQGTVRHPVTGEWSWFNQAHLFHVSSLPDELRTALRRDVDPAELPRNALYGDGAPIEDEVIAEIRAAYDAETVAEPWDDGDVMVVDNVLAAHGRQPYTGRRRVLVAMAEPGSAG